MITELTLEFALYTAFSAPPALLDFVGVGSSTLKELTIHLTTYEHPVSFNANRILTPFILPLADLFDLVRFLHLVYGQLGIKLHELAKQADHSAPLILVERELHAFFPNVPSWVHITARGDCASVWLF